MKEAGLILETWDNKAKVQFNRTSACAKCKACGIMAGQDQIVVTAENALHAKEGDRVEVQFNTKNALTTSAIAYLFPLAMLILGVVVGFLIPAPTDRQPIAAIMGIAFTAVAFLILKLANPYFKRKFTNTYKITNIL
jgi:sigma-E factor negative regulatory protein RseC